MNTLRDAQIKQSAQVSAALAKVKTPNATFHVDLANDHDGTRHGP